MSQRTITVNNKLRLVEDAHEHGFWTAHDVSTGVRLGSSIRLVSDIADILGRLRPPKEDGKDE